MKIIIALSVAFALSAEAHTFRAKEVSFAPLDDDVRILYFAFSWTRLTLLI